MKPLPIIAKLKSSIYLTSAFISLAALTTLTACQTSPTTSQNLTPQQSQTLLNSAIKHTLYRGQDVIAEQQIRLTNPIPKSITAKHDPVQQKIDCQNTHDTALISQMKADSISKYEAVADLLPTSRHPYEAIRDQYQDCIAKADALEQSQQQEALQAKKDRLAEKGKAPATASSTTENETLVTEESLSESYLNDVIDTSVTRQLSPVQIQNFNNFVAQSGKLIYTGNYRPFAGKLAVQVDAGFENKNLKYHYRVPAVIDIKSQTLYLKPDIIMPMTALYMDNQLGMSWQDKWYKFNPPKEKQLPTKLVAKSWLKAIQEGFMSLPASQFNQVTADMLNQQINTNLKNISQPLTAQAMTNNVPIIHWRQSASEQAMFYQAVIQKFISRMDNELQTDSAFLALPADKKEAQLKKWQDYKQKLSEYANHLTQAFSDNPNDSQNPDTIHKAKQHKLTGQDSYFILGKDQLKHIYLQQTAPMLDQLLTTVTWVTFDPDNRNLAENIQPATLAKLTNTIRDDNSANSNVLDGKSEFKRIETLDNSRRLFGQEPDVIKAYKTYKEMADSRMKGKNTESKNAVSEKQAD